MKNAFNILFTLAMYILGYTTFNYVISSSLVGSEKQRKILYSIDFANASKASDIKEWLEKQGFAIKEDPSGLNIYYDKGSIVFDTKGEIFSYMIKSDLDIKNAKIIRITWGVNTFPDGASYENGINNESLMVYIYYGKKLMRSGSIFIPKSPYFLGLFLSKSDIIGKYYIGRHFKDGGRFVCIGNPRIHETVISEFDLQKGFKQGFGQDKIVPPISGIGLEVETSSTGDAKAFIKKIEIM